MIKIMNYGEVPNSEIFARENIAANVEGVVSDIIAHVRAAVIVGNALGQLVQCQRHLPVALLSMLCFIAVERELTADRTHVAF